MNSRSKILSLMLALAAGSASAVSAGTTAGTSISNVATASFTDPATGTPATPVASTPVVTTVTALTGFDINYTAGTDDTSPTTGPFPSGYDKPNTPALTAGVQTQVATTYTVVNNSNIDNYVVEIVPAVSTPSGSPALTAANVKYYKAGTTSFVPANELPVSPSTNKPYVVLNNGSQLDIVQVVTIPAGAAAGSQYSASPNGTAVASAGATNTNYPGGNGTTGVAAGAPATTYAAYAESSNQNTPGTPATNGDLEYTHITIATATLTPKSPADTDPKTPAVTPPATPPTGPTPPPTIPTTNPTYNPPVNPAGTPQNTPGTVIVVDPVSGDQKAYPKSDADANPDVVTFVSDIKNGANVPDQVIIKPDLSGLPAGTTIKVLDKAGNILTETSPGSGKYVVPYDPANPATLTPAGGTATYQLVVTYPDSDSVTPDPVISVPVGIFSGVVVPSATPLATSNFTIYPPNLVFGDTQTAPAAPNPAPAVQQTVIPGAATSVTSNSQTDSSAVFPMSVKNTGTYDEAYTLSAPAVVFKDASGANLPAATVTYYDSTGTALPAGVTPIIPVGQTANFYAVVNVPATAAVTTGPAGSNPEPKLTQTATGNYSGDTATDINDYITVGYLSGSRIGVVKTQSVTPVAPHANAGVATPYAATPANAAPLDALNYRIVATNNYNGPVANFRLSDAAADIFGASKKVDFVSTKVSISGFTGTASTNLYYSTDGGATWAAVPAPTTSAFTPTVNTNGLQFAVDTDNSNSITAADIVPAGASITVDIATTVK